MSSSQEGKDKGRDAFWALLPTPGDLEWLWEGHVQYLSFLI